MNGHNLIDEQLKDEHIELIAGFPDNWSVDSATIAAAVLVLAQQVKDLSLTITESTWKSSNES